MAPPAPPTPPPPAQQPKEVRKSPRTLIRESVERRKARFEQAEIEYAAHEKRALAREAAIRKQALARKNKKGLAGKGTKKKRVNAATKRKPSPGKPQKKKPAKKGTTHVEFDLHDDDDDDDDNDDNDDDNDHNDDDDDDDDVIGNNDGNDDDIGGNNDGNDEDIGGDNNVGDDDSNGGDKIVDKQKGTKKKRVNAATKRKRKPSPGKPQKKTAKKGTTNVEFDMHDDDDDDDNDDDVMGNNNGNDDDVGGNNNVGDDDSNGGDKIVDKRKVDDDDDDESYHDDGEDSDSDSSDDGDGRGGVATSTGHTASAVQPIAVVRTPPTAAASSLLNLDGLIHIRGMSRTESMKCRQKFVTQRINTFVKAELFRRIKFIRSDETFINAMQLVMDHEDVPPQHRLNFQRTYETVFHEALNTKRSACEQSGGKIVHKTMAEFEKVGEEFFTMEELLKLRGANTERERKAFFWFFGTYLECVCGKRQWGAKKLHELVSKARDKDRGQKRVVTKSDEAFALVLFENYIDKWKLQRQPVPVDGANADNAGKKQRMKGKYTGTKNGLCKYGGWSVQGIDRFNDLREIVKQDRACEQAETMEKELLEFCRSQKRGRGHHGGNTQGEQEQEGNQTVGSEVRNASLVVEAAWDSDD